MQYYHNQNLSLKNTTPHRQQSLLKFFFKNHQKPFFPPLQTKRNQQQRKQKHQSMTIQHQLANEQYQFHKQNRMKIQQTVKKLHDRHFNPYGASKARKLQIIKSKKQSQKIYRQQRKNTFSNISGLVLNNQDAIVASLKQNRIVSCTLEESILFG